MSPGDRLPGETPPAFEAWCCYRDMGPGRSLVKVSQRSGKHRTLLERWSRRWSWVERAKAWDDELDRIGREHSAAAVRRMADDHAQLAAAMLAKVSEALRTFDPAKITAANLPGWIDVGTRIERLCRGQATSIEQKIADPDELELQERVSRHQGMLILQALRGILEELGVADLPQTPSVVRKHLEAVCELDEASDEEQRIASVTTIPPAMS
jgi:hypothetical protein